MTSPPRNVWPVILPWVIAGIAMFIVAGLAGVGAAYIVTTANAVATVDPDLLPTPTPRRTATAAAGASLTPGASASVAPSATTAPTPAASPSSSAEPTPTESAAGPTPTPISYVVKRGDRLSAIAAQFGVTVDALVELNKLKNPDHIEVGQVLLIPVP